MNFRTLLLLLSVLVVFSVGRTAAERPYLRTDSGPARYLRYSSIYATAWHGTDSSAVNLHIRVSHTASGSMTLVEWLIVNDTDRDLHSAAIADREYECSNGEVITVKGNWWTDPLRGRRVYDPFPRMWMRRAGVNPDIILHKKSPRGQKECPRVTGIRLKGDADFFVKYLINKGDKDWHSWVEGGRVEVYRKMAHGMEIK